MTVDKEVKVGRDNQKKKRGRNRDERLLSERKKENLPAGAQTKVEEAGEALVARKKIKNAEIG